MLLCGLGLCIESDPKRLNPYTGCRGFPQLAHVEILSGRPVTLSGT